MNTYPNLNTNRRPLYDEDSLEDAALEKRQKKHECGLHLRCFRTVVVADKTYTHTHAHTQTRHTHTGARVCSSRHPPFDALSHAGFAEPFGRGLFSSMLTDGTVSRQASPCSPISLQNVAAYDFTNGLVLGSLVRSDHNERDLASSQERLSQR